MEKFKYLMLIGVSMFACTGLLSCYEDMYEEEEEEPVEAKIVITAEIADIQGKWHGYFGNLYHTFWFTDSNYVYGSDYSNFFGMISNSWGTYKITDGNITFNNDNDVSCDWSGSEIYFSDSMKTTLVIGDSLTLERMNDDTINIEI